MIGNTEFSYTQMPASGPILDQTYPKFQPKLVDYFVAKKVNLLRYMFSWEGVQSALSGSIPATGNFKTYFDNYKAAVDYATSKGVTVVIQPWDADSSGGAGGFRYKGAQPSNEAFADFWSKVATIFKNNPKVVFGLINEPNHQGTLAWWSAAQAAVTAIRATGATQTISVPGVSYTQASTWTGLPWDDTESPKHSNAYGYLNAGGVGKKLSDPLSNLWVEVHTYLDVDQGGGADAISSITAARTQLTPAVNEARKQGYKLYLAEMSLYAGDSKALAAWNDFQAYLKANEDVIVAYSWFCGGQWWPDVHAPHFSVSPTNMTTYTGDTINMTLIQGMFQ